jgi:hypothetical protein
MTTRHPLAALTAAQAAGQAGQWVAWLAVVYAALHRPHAALWVAVATIAWNLPQALASVFGGLIDWWGPRWAGSTAWALAAGAAIVPVVTRLSLIELTVILAMTTLLGTCGVVAGDAVPAWLDDASQTEGGAALSAAISITIALAALSGTWLVVSTGQRGAWALAAGLPVTGALISLTIPATRPAPESHKRYRVPPVVRRILVLTAGLWLILGIVSATEALYVTHVLHTRYVVYGWLLVTYAAAGIAAALAAVRWPRLAERPGAVTATALVFALGLPIYIGTADIMIATGGAAVFGYAAAMARIAIRKVITKAMPEQYHGRVCALAATVRNTGMTIGPAVAGFAVTAYGLRTVLDSTCALAGMVVLAYAGSQPSRGAHAAGRRSRTGPARPSRALPADSAQQLTWSAGPGMSVSDGQI